VTDSPLEENEPYLVVVNHEGFYSIWFAGRELPAGWTPEGARGTRQECLEHIEKLWTDMRPRRQASID
jgi:MbtH protein